MFFVEAVKEEAPKQEGEYEAFEANIKNEPVEHGQFFDAEGNPLGDEFKGQNQELIFLVAKK